MIYWKNFESKSFTNGLLSRKEELMFIIFCRTKPRTIVPDFFQIQHEVFFIIFCKKMPQTDAHNFLAKKDELMFIFCKKLWLNVFDFFAKQHEKTWTNVHVFCKSHALMFMTFWNAQGLMFIIFAKNIMN